MAAPGILGILTKRGDVLKRLSETAAYKRDLAEEMEYSRSTINRAVSELEERDLVRRVEGGYEASVAGRLAVQYLEEFRDGIGDLTAADGVLAPLPADAEITPEAVAGSDALLAADPAPFRPLERVHDALAEADRYRAVLPALDDSRHVRLLYEHVVTDDRPAELIVSPDLFDTLREEFPRQTAVMAKQEAFRVLVADDLPPFALTLADTGTSADEFASATETTVSMVVFSQSGGVHGVLANETASAVEWAESRLAAARLGATDRTDGLAPDPDDGQPSPAASGVGSESSAVGQSLPVELERAGFVRLDPSYFRDEPVADPTTAWRAGLSLPEVNTGYAVERTVGDEAGGQLLDADDASAEETTVPAALHDELAAGTDCLVVGPPGSGKSTVCKQVACAWYDDRGPVLYREQGRGRPFGGVDELIETVDAVEGHTLVVVEDAVRPEANAVFECVDRLADREDASVLLDARENEWRDPPGDVDPGLDLAVVTMPGLTDLDVGRLVDHFEETVGEQVDIPRDRLREDVREEAESDDVAPSGVVLLLHRLTTIVDPLAEEQTNLEEAAAAVYDDLAGDEVALDVCVLANVLNAAGLAVTPDLLYAVGDADAFGDVDSALDRLEWEMLFPRPDGRYRTVHETWSAAFLDYLLDAEGEAAAARRFGDAVTALLGLADDAGRRERITSHLGTQWELETIAYYPEGWAEGTAEAVYTMGRERPKLGPLFGDGSRADDSIELPAACAEAVEAQRPIWLGRLYSDGGYYDRAERAFDRLPTPQDVAGSDGEDFDRAVERLLGLARIAREQASYDDTETFAGRCLALLGDDDRPVAHARAKLRLGQAASERGEFDTADSEYRDALSAFEKAGDRRRTAATLRAVGDNARRQGENDRAREYFERALAIHQDLGDRQGVARTFNSLGVAARRQGEFDTAQGYFERSLGIARDLGDRKLRADILNNIGIVASIRGAYDHAREYYERSLAVTRELGDSQGVEHTLTNLALILERLGEYDRAREHFEEALEHRQARDDRPGVASIHTNIGLVFARQGRYDRAREHHEKCLAISRELGLQHEEPQGLDNLAMVGRLQGQYDLAREHLEESLAIKQETGDLQGTMNSLFGLGQVALADGEYEDAREYFERAGDVLEEGDQFRVTEGQVAQARLAVEQGRLDDARELAAAAREAFAEMGSTHWVARSRRVLGRIEAAAGDHKAAHEHWEAILDTFEAVGAPQDTLEALRLLLDDARERGDNDAAQQWRDRIEDCLGNAPAATVDAHREWLGDNFDSVSRADPQPGQEVD